MTSDNQDDLPALDAHGKPYEQPELQGAPLQGAQLQSGSLQGAPKHVIAPLEISPVGRLDGVSRLGPVRRVLFLGKSMSRTRCTGALVDSLRRHGVEVRWRNLVTLRRWFGAQIANKLVRAEFRSYKPDVVFVFFRDLPQPLRDRAEVG